MTSWILGAFGFLLAAVGVYAARLRMAQKKVAKMQQQAVRQEVDGKLAVSAEKAIALERDLVLADERARMAQERSDEARTAQESAEDRIAQRAARWPPRNPNG